jgi:hypothetical protein
VRALFLGIGSLKAQEPDFSDERTKTGIHNVYSHFLAPLTNGRRGAGA